MAAAGVDAILAGGPPMFEALVAQLLMADDTARSQAEAVFEQLKGHPDALITYFVTLMRSSVSEEHRVFSAIMLRKVLTLAAHQWYTKLSSWDTRSRVQPQAMPCSSALAACCSNGLGCAACEGCLNVLPVAGAYQGRPPAVGQVQRFRAGAWERRRAQQQLVAALTQQGGVARNKILSDQPGSGTSKGPAPQQAAAGLPITTAAVTIRTMLCGAARAEWFITLPNCAI